jgi:hypothetical protein
MAKQEAEWSNRLNISFFKKHGYLNKDNSYSSGSIKWTYGIGGSESSVGFSVNRDNWGTPRESCYIKLRYTHTSSWTGEKESMAFNVRLAQTRCNYGGSRYWFICPLSKNGSYCGRRVGVLFSIGKWFGCRHCGDIAYAAQMKGGRWRGSSVSLPDIERAEGEIKRTYYAGKPTKKYIRYLKMCDKFDRDFIRMAASLGVRPKA